MMGIISRSRIVTSPWILAMIDVELQFQVGNFQLENQIARKCKIVEKITGHVARVDRLDHHVDAMGGEELGGVIADWRNAATACGSLRWAMPAIRCRRLTPVACA